MFHLWLYWVSSLILLKLWFFSFDNWLGGLNLFWFLVDCYRCWILIWFFIWVSACVALPSILYLFLRLWNFSSLFYFDLMFYLRLFLFLFEFLFQFLGLLEQIVICIRPIIIIILLGNLPSSFRILFPIFYPLFILNWTSNHLINFITNNSKNRAINKQRSL